MRSSCICRSPAFLLLLLGSPAWSVKQEIVNAWPTPIFTVNDPNLPGARGKDEKRRFRKRLAAVGEAAFARYVDEILPKELELDPSWRERYEDIDGSPANIGFNRWQKKVQSLNNAISVQEINWDGHRVPKYPGLLYDWPELYNSEEYDSFMEMADKWCSHYVETTRGSKEELRIFAWAEVYAPGDFQVARPITGAPVSGIYVARGNRQQSMVFQDERGKIAPFGQEHSEEMYSGKLMVLPAWATIRFTPNLGNKSNVYFRFWVSYFGGIRDFDWEDDPVSDWKPTKHNQLVKKKD